MCCVHPFPLPPSKLCVLSPQQSRLYVLRHGDFDRKDLSGMSAVINADCFTSRLLLSYVQASRQKLTKLSGDCNWIDLAWSNLLSRICQIIPAYKSMVQALSLLCGFDVLSQRLFDLLFNFLFKSSALLKYYWYWELWLVSSGQFRSQLSNFQLY